ncbi:hypothetical protein [Amycolatopsis vancoresmycina]|uniref:Carbohydrate binding family 6 n=1 Tax=Amycolatopsis vancoresmycina DSM 44592 TaxID=1292037 RepID=R1FYH0_9PSEU|nr:hypothetical protein [Amycolatopsis vancoresmycina]EOD64352.1 carbohydrate binding family 6 [Amycolatopsis vancoresmycina DSM 44592]
MRKLLAVLCCAFVTTIAVAVPVSAAPGGTVPGLTGAAAKAAAGPMAEKFRQLRQPASLAQRHTFWGPEPQLSSGADGVVVTQSITPGLRISNTSDVVYAPTMKPTGHSCIEVVTAYGLGEAAQVWAWDWCRSVSPAKVVPIDSTFLATYTSSVNGHPAYTVQEVRTSSSGNSWTASLRNVKTGGWDTLFSQSGSDQSSLNEGWDIFELYSTRNPATGNAYYCSDARGAVFESSSLQLRIGGRWTDASPSNSPLRPTANPRPADYDCSTLRFEVPSPNSTWRVTV